MWAKELSFPTAVDKRERNQNMGIGMLDPVYRSSSSSADARMMLLSDDAIVTRHRTADHPGGELRIYTDEDSSSSSSSLHTTHS